MRLRHLGFGVLCLILATGCMEKRERPPVISQASGNAPSPKPPTSDGTAYGGGTLAGSVTFAKQPPDPVKLVVVKDAEVCRRGDRYDDSLLVGRDGGVRNAVVSLVKVSGGKPLSALGARFVLDQRACVYEPHALLLPVNTPLRILNEDGILHNIHTYPKVNPAQNVAQPPALKQMEMRFALPERIQIRCDLHGWMNGWIIVVDHPYHAVTDSNGGFAMTDIPPGKYTVSCWHEVLGEQTREIEISANAASPLDFSFR